MTLYICIDGGGTQSRAGLYDASGALLHEKILGPSNPLAYGDDACFSIIQNTLSNMPLEEGASLVLAMGLAGSGDEAWRRNFMARFAKLPSVDVVRITSDLDPLLYANAPDCPAIAAIAGTGSSVLAKNQSGGIIRIGGRGTVLGDEGSAYGLAVRAMHAAAHAYDGCGASTCLGGDILSALNLEQFNALTPWSLRASKKEIAALADTVIKAALRGDVVASECIDLEAKLLALQIEAAANRLDFTGELPLFLCGGLIEHNAIYLEYVKKHLAHLESLNIQCPPPLQGHRALLPLAMAPENPSWATEWRRGDGDSGYVPGTEAATAVCLDELTPQEIVQVMIDAASNLAQVMLAQAVPLAQCVEAAANALQAGGRIIYVGAGTSGRLGVLDASECPPTFGVPADRVLGVIAGGEIALTRSVEGAEDDTVQAEQDMDALQLVADDFVLGIAASGTTPYTVHAVQCAARSGVRTAFLCCTPVPQCKADIIIALDTGAEVLPGSTRLKAGTATKMALNIISTGAMARAGFVYRGRMVYMKPINAKLKARAVRMVAELCGIGEDEALGLLEAAGWEIAVALAMQSEGNDVEQSRKRGIFRQDKPD